MSTTNDKPEPDIVFLDTETLVIDIENVAAGYIRGLHAARGTDMPVLPPYDSNELSRAVNVNPDDFQRHTAMGDVQWVRAQWDAIMGGAK